MMTTWKRIACLSLVSSSFLLAEQWTGWLTDQKCARDPAGNYTGDIHQKHVEEGQPIVFVNEADKTIHVLAGGEKVEKMVGKKVTLTGTAQTDGTIQVQSAAAAR
jgi:hypothetical protein